MELTVQTDYEIFDEPCLNYFDCVIVDFVKKRACVIGCVPFGEGYLRHLLPDFDIRKLNLMELLEKFTNEFLGVESNELAADQRSSDS